MSYDCICSSCKKAFVADSSSAMVCNACLPGTIELACEKEGELQRWMRPVTHDIWHERRRQERKWGAQNHDFGYYQGILMEELGEANKEWIESVAQDRKAATETNPGMAVLARDRAAQQRRNMRTELIQTAAVLHAMIECGDRNNWWPK